jgi:hypothetical protein
MELTEKAEKYAVGKANAAMDKAIAQAYADGYRDGYKDREEEIPMDLRDNMTEYVDLELPSGTLWANEYEKDANNNILYLPYIQAKRYNIPTKKQWEELVAECQWGWFGKALRCTGKNGAWIDFLKTGGVCPSYSNGDKSYLWLLGDSIDAQNELACFEGENFKIIVKSFMGYKYPIRQVR